MNKFSNLKNYEEKFLRLIIKLEPLEYFGAVRLMGVTIFDENGEVRPVETMTLEAVNKFTTLSTTKKKEIIKLCKEAQHAARTDLRKKKHNV